MRNIVRTDIPNKNAETPEKLNWQIILPIFMIVALDAASAGAVLPILPFYLRELGATPLILGFVLGAEALSQFVMAPWLGQLSDRFGRKKILLMSQVGALLSLSLLVLANSVVFVLLARVLLGFTVANFSAAVAYVADNSSKANRRQAIGILSAGLGLGGIIGPGLSGYLSDFSLSFPIMLALALSLTSLIVTTIGVKGLRTSSQSINDAKAQQSKQEKRSFRSLFATPIIRILVIVLLCHYVSYGLFSSQFAIFLSDTFTWNGHAFGPKELSYILTADGVINVVVQLFLLKWLGNYFTERNLIILVFCVLSIGYVVAGAASEMMTLAVAVLCISTGVALARPTFMAAFSIHVSEQRQGFVIGMLQSLVAATDVVTPVLAGLIIGQRLYGLWIGTIVAITIIGALIAQNRLK